MKYSIIEGTDTPDGRMRISITIKGKNRRFLEVLDDE